MVRTRSREVAAISREVAPISVVVAAVSVAVACCLEVAAISVTEVVTCTEERWACDTRPLSSSAMPLKPVSMAPNSSRRPRFRRAVRSPPAIRSRLRTIFWIGWVIARNSRNPQMPATTTASNRVTSMLSSASSTALTMFSEARSAMSLFSSISSLRYLRPSRQCSVNGPATSLPASSKRFAIQLEHLVVLLQVGLAHTQETGEQFVVAGLVRVHGLLVGGDLLVQALLAGEDAVGLGLAQLVVVGDAEQFLGLQVVVGPRTAYQGDEVHPRHGVVLDTVGALFHRQHLHVRSSGHQQHDRDDHGETCQDSLANSPVLHIFPKTRVRIRSCRHNGPSIARTVGRPRHRQAAP